MRLTKSLRVVSALLRCRDHRYPDFLTVAMSGSIQTRSDVHFKSLSHMHLERQALTCRPEDLLENPITFHFAPVIGSEYGPHVREDKNAVELVELRETQVARWPSPQGRNTVTCYDARFRTAYVRFPYEFRKESDLPLPPYFDLHFALNEAEHRALMSIDANDFLVTLEVAGVRLFERAA